MKKLLLSLLVLSAMSISAQTITSTQSGNATNPFTWDCTCIPTPGSNIVIAHNVAMDTDWIHTGTITVNAGASFEESGSRSILFDGAIAELINNGTTTLTSLGFSNGANLDNNGGMVLDTGIWVSSNSTASIDGTIDCDSLLFEGDVTVTTGATVTGGDMYTSGLMDVSGVVQVDSLLNDGTFTVQGGGTVYAFDLSTTNMMLLNGNANVYVTNSFSNFLLFEMNALSYFEVGNDFFNGNFSNATINVEGTIIVNNDFSNTDNINGTSGRICIGGLSSNTGTISGSIDICDPSAGAGVVDSNLGTIAGTVTACATNCFVGLDDPKIVELSIYPNPAQQELIVSGFNGTVSIHDLTGRLVIQRMVQGQKSINVEALTNGVYVLRAGDQTLRFVKN